MMDAILDWWQLNFWVGTACFVAGIAVVSPFLLSKSFRKWFSRSDIDIEAIGLAAFVVVVVAIGLYNYFGR